MELLGTYSTTRINTNSYNLTFSYPDNCIVLVSDKNGLYSIAISLKKGETKPSLNYITDNVICNQYDGCIEIQFVQQNYKPIGGDWGDGNSTKPTVKISIDG